MNSFDWDLLVDEELALAAEKTGLEKAKAAAGDKTDETLNLASTPYAESVRLGQVLYAVPGDYTVRVSVADKHDSIGLKINPPKAFEPRTKKTYKLRGKKE